MLTTTEILRDLRPRPWVGRFSGKAQKMLFEDLKQQLVLGPDAAAPSRYWIGDITALIKNLFGVM